MRKIEKIKLIKLYQVPGAVNDFDPNNYKEQENAIGWEDHVAGSFIYPVVGKIFLGLPTGFCRLGKFNDMKLMIFESYKQYYDFYDLPFNVPVWKHLDEHGNTLVRGLMPRINTPFIAVIAGDCRKDIDCLEITKEMIKDMD